MCKSKKIIAALLALGMTISLSACGESASLFTDTGSSNQQDVRTEDYLMLEVLDQEEQTVDTLYTVHTLAKGDFQEEALKQILRRDYLNVPTENITLDGISATFGYYIAEYYQYVEKGDVIATLVTEVDELALQEAKIKLQRLQERYLEAETEVNEALEEIQVQKDYYSYNNHDKWLNDMKYQQKLLDWEKQKYDYESKIEDAQEELDKLTKVGKIYEVKASISGYVSYSTRYRSGEEMKDGQYICHIMDSNVIYVTTRDQAEFFHYGMDVGFDNRTGLTPATVINGGSWLLYGNLDSGKTVFRLDFEQDISELDNSTLNNLVLKGNLKEVKNVILIPKAAVTVEEDEYYVTVLKDDGTLLKTEFIPGGSNVESYWVLEGLTEGTKIVYN